jgi:acyl-CoA synthetase (AMP-forming)/AMP-acid ligase II
VHAAIAFGVEDSHWGQMVAAVVSGSEDIADLRQFLRDRVAAFKIPKAFAFAPLDDMPITSSGKPNRRLARERFSRLLRRD